MTTFTYKSTTGLAVNIDNKYNITVEPGLQYLEPINALDKHVGSLLARYTDGVLDTSDGEDSQLITASTNLTISHANDLIKAEHATVPIVLTVLKDSLGGFSGSPSLAACQTGAAAVTIVAGADVTIRGTMPTISQWGVMAVARLRANEWVYLA